MTEENIPEFYRPDADPAKVEEANDYLHNFVQRVGIREAIHIEAWLSACNRITSEEHAVAAEWVKARRLGQEAGPPPPGITKMKNLPDLDEHFWDCCEKFNMYDTKDRWNFVKRIVQRKAGTNA